MGHPVRRQPAASGLQGSGIGIKRLPRYPEWINSVVTSRPRLRERHRRQPRPGDVEAGTAPGTDQTLGRKTVIGFHDTPMVAAKLRIEGSRSPITRARLATLARIAAITSPVRVASMPAICIPTTVLPDTSVQFYRVVLHCPCSRKAGCP